MFLGLPAICGVTMGSNCPRMPSWLEAVFSGIRACNQKLLHASRGIVHRKKPLSRFQVTRLVTRKIEKTAPNQLSTCSNHVSSWLNWRPVRPLPTPSSFQKAVRWMIIYLRAYVYICVYAIVGYRFCSRSLHASISYLITIFISIPIT